MSFLFSYRVGDSENEQVFYQANGLPTWFPILDSVLHRNEKRIEEYSQPVGTLDIGNLGGIYGAQAFAINDSGQVVGSSTIQ